MPSLRSTAPLLWLLALVGCDDAEKQSPTPAPPVEAPARPVAQPYELADLTLSRAIDAPGLEALLAPLLAGTGSTALADGVTLSVETDPTTAERRIATVTLAPVGDGAPEVLLRVPMSRSALETFAEAGIQGLAVTDGEETPAPFEARYAVESPNGGTLRFTVSIGRFEAHLVSAPTSLIPETIYLPLMAADAQEVVSARIRFGLDYLTFRRLILSAFDPAASNAGLEGCSELSEFGANAPHVWYDLCVRAQDLALPAIVEADLVTRDGRRVPIARSPAGIRTAKLWLSAVDRLAAARKSDGVTTVALPTATFDYRDPAVQGGSVFTASVEGGEVVFDHRSLTPPTSLPDVDPVERPATTTAPPLPDDPCTPNGSTLASAGRLVIDALLDAQLADHGGFDLPLSGTARASIYRADQVTIVGPNADAEALDTFALADLALDTTTPAGRHVSVELPAGRYMVLGFFDVGSDADPGDPQPVAGEPVTLPLRAVDLKCAEQPATLLFDAPFPG